jgi:hypothetical protein
MVASNAEAANGRTDYSFYVKKDNFGCNTNKCNKFVHDMAASGGAGPLVKGADGKMRAPTAGELASPGAIGNWQIVSSPQRGDIAAYKPGVLLETCRSSSVDYWLTNFHTSSML